MKITWLVVFIFIVQQQIVQNPNIKLGIGKENEHTGITTEIINSTCDHCHPYDFPIMQLREAYKNEYKRIAILTPDIWLNKDIEKREPLLNSKKSLKIIDTLIVASKSVDINQRISSVYKLGMIYIFLADGEIKGVKKDLAKKLAPKIMQVLINGINDDDRRVKEQSIMYLYYIAQINNQYQIFDHKTKELTIMSIKQNLPQAQSLYLSNKFNQTYEEFLR